MKETQLQEIFYRYQKSQDQNQKEDCVREISVVVYNYSQKNFPHDKDVGSDFFVELYPQIDDLIKDYNPQLGVSFKNYLSFRLMFLTRSFARKRKRQTKFVQFQSFEELSFHEIVHSVFSKNRPSQFYSKEESKTLGQIAQTHLESLPSDMQLLLKLHLCLPLTFSDFRYLYQHTKSKDFLSDFRKLQKIAEKRKEKLNLKRMNYKQKLLRYSLLMRHHPTLSHQYSKHYQALIKKNPSMLEGLRYREIATLMSMSISGVQRKIKMAQNLLYQVLSKEKDYDL